MITDLKDAGFDERQSRGVVQAVVDTTASLPLVTRTALARVVAALNGKINVLIKKIAEVKEGMLAIKEDLAAHKTEIKEDIAELKATVDKIYLWLRRGFGLLFAFMLFLSRVG